MKKITLPVFIILLVLTIALCVQAQPGAGGGMSGRGGMTIAVQRPNKETRLAAITELQKQLDTLKAAIQKAEAKDPCLAGLTGDNRNNFMNQYNEENNAINSIVTTINSLRPMGGMMGGNITAAQITELTALAKEDKATKLTARLDALAKEAAAAPQMGNRGGMGGGSSRVPKDGFEWMD
jgi:hypothetical protein